MKDYRQPFEEIKTLVEKQNYGEAASRLELLMREIEQAYQGKKGVAISFNHILEVYEYDYFFAPEESPAYLDVNISAFYRFYGFALMRLGKLPAAIRAYQSALSWNSVDLDALFQLVELFKQAGQPNKVRKYTLDCYNYCCTRATMARFYRNLGFYYLESYQPETAAALYLYSNIYYESKQAQSELDFLEKALGKPAKAYTLPQMQDILKANQIPIGPNPDTVGIAYRVGQLELEAGNRENAKDCFAMVYDLTMDEEAGQLLKTL